GTVTSFIADGTTLTVRDAVTLTATGNSKQYSEASSYTVGLLAVGANIASAVSETDTTAFLGKEGSLSNGQDIGGRQEGQTYHVVLEASGPFGQSDVDTASNTIDLGANPGLETGDRVIYNHRTNKPATGAVGGLTDLATYKVDVLSSGRIGLRDDQTG